MSAQVMGIVNVTPDSFSDGGRWMDLDSAVAHGRTLFAQGANIVDVGGESTRPGAAEVSIDEECSRTIPVVERLSGMGRVSIDTRHAEVALAAIDAGASLVNDVSGTLSGVAGSREVGWVAMHMKGTPETMQHAPHYDDVVAEVQTHLLMLAQKAKDEGVPEVFLDPGIGFGKTVEHNVELLRHIDRFVASGYPVLIGTSRKSFLGALTAVNGVMTPVADRLAATLATTAWSVMRDVAVLRVHDVLETVHCIRVLDAIMQGDTGVRV